MSKRAAWGPAAELQLHQVPLAPLPSGFGFGSGFGCEVLASGSASGSAAGALVSRMTPDARGLWRFAELLGGGDGDEGDGGGRDHGGRLVLSTKSVSLKHSNS